jgi:hypothetical protein
MTQESINNNPLVKGSDRGWVLVWDLDNTIVGEYSDQRKLDSPDIVLNPKAVELLRNSVEARDKDIVRAIFLLTNNADDFFIKVVQLTLANILKKNYLFDIFDATMSRNHEYRDSPKDNPPKSLREVIYMMNEIGANTEHLAERVFFIDDRSDHQIAKEIPREHYIHVTPPFTKGSVDTTDYSTLELALRTKRGGTRKKPTRKRKFFRFSLQKGRRSIKTHKHK